MQIYDFFLIFRPKIENALYFKTIKKLFIRTFRIGENSKAPPFQSLSFDLRLSTFDPIQYF